MTASSRNRLVSACISRVSARSDPATAKPISSSKVA
jgi:hypothetical protein